MTNVSHISTSLVLLGVVEMESFKYLYSTIALVVYFIIMSICVMIVYICRTEKSLHEPMYIFICNLVTDVMIGSSAFFPKLAIDLLTGCSTITSPGCLTQAFWIQSFSSVEVCTFSVMAFDRYLAVGNPLRYHSLMTNGRAMTFIAVLWSIVVIMEMVLMILCSKLTICGININNAFCETVSFVHLSCSDASTVTLFGSVWSLLLLAVPITVSIYCYIGTFIVCLNISLEASQKAIQTLVTHIVAFSFTTSMGIFVLFRFRLNTGSTTTLAHVVISVTGLGTALVVNPLIYGLRTEALRKKMIQIMKNLFQWTHKGCLHDK